MKMTQSETETKTKRRHEILEEILKSERAYVDFLDKLIQVCFVSLLRYKQKLVYTVLKMNSNFIL